MKNGEIALCTPSLHSTRAPLKPGRAGRTGGLAVRRCLCSIIRITRFRLPNAAQWVVVRQVLRRINFALLAGENGKRYSDGSANNLTHKTFEAIQYHSA